MKFLSLLLRNTWDSVSEIVVPVLLVIASMSYVFGPMAYITATYSHGLLSFSLSMGWFLFSAWTLYIISKTYSDYFYGEKE